MWTTPDGYVLRLPRSGIMKIISRLQDSGLKDLAESHDHGNLEVGIASSVGQLAKSARRTGSAYHEKTRQKYPIFTALANGGKYLILTRPLTIRQNAILFVRFEPRVGSPESKNGESSKAQAAWQIRDHPNVLKRAEVLQQEARSRFFKANPHLKGKVEVYHRFPLEWRQLFPKQDPNRLSNLVGLQTPEQRRKLAELWKTFRRTYRRLKRSPTPKEVVRHVRFVDKEFFVGRAISNCR
jgi:hypothetical protein